MAHSFRFAVQTGPFGQPAELRSFATKVESLGYAELYNADHINGGGLNNTDPFLPLLVAAEATSTLKFGPLVLNNEFYNPALLARSAASFDLLTGGRLVLGMGTGYAQAEHDAIGVRLRAPGDRVTRFEESIEALRSLLDTGSSHCDGEHITLSVDDLGVRPAQDRVPILIGGHGKRVVSIAGRRADVFQFTGLESEPATGQPMATGFAPAELSKRSEWLKASAAERYDNIELSALVQRTLISDDSQSVSTLKSEVADRIGADVNTVEDSPFVLIGSTGEVVEKLQRLRENLGIHHYVTRDPENCAPVVAALNGN